jgi:signal recognition particle receptor subunit beta
MKTKGQPMSTLLKIVGYLALSFIVFGVFYKTLEYIGDEGQASNQANAIFSTIIGIVSGMLKLKFSSLENELRNETEKSEQLSRRLAGPRFSLPEKSKEKYVRVAIAGLGGTGKTSLIRKISGCRLADPRRKTGSAKTYSFIKEIAYEDRTEVYRIDLEDYRGQNVAELLTNIHASDKRFPVTAIIMMVDLFETESDMATFEGENVYWDETRVNKHLREWSDSLIGALLAATPEVKYICLFINKADLVNVPIKTVSREIESLFVPIISSFKARGADKLIKILIGSALTDFMLNTLVIELTEDASVELDKYSSEAQP